MYLSVTLTLTLALALALTLAPSEAMMTIFSREHNYVCDQLVLVYPERQL